MNTQVRKLSTRAGQLVFVSNRLPVTISEEAGAYRLAPSSGGLVTALLPILHAAQGYWVGWPGFAPARQIHTLFAENGPEYSRLIPVSLSQQEQRDFYCGFSNEIVWPLFHDLQSRCNFDPAYWRAYVSVNRRFAETVAAVTSADSIVWVHDYHLMLLGRMLRHLGLSCRLAFFQHIPFPPPDIFEKLPWRGEILRALFDFDVVGFQTLRDQNNFANCVRRLLPEIDLHCAEHRLIAQVDGRMSSIGTFPISIDFDRFSREAALPEVTERMMEIRQHSGDCQIVLGVDRLDYTKGVPERLKAFRHLLATRPHMRNRVILIQLVVPSREDIANYQDLKLEIEQLVSQINGQFGSPAWVPVHYIHRHLERLELLASYRAADIALITPLKDGMNLVSKEFCAARVDDSGVLILSEFAGAADQLGSGALLVNPYDVEQVSRALDQALCMGGEDRKSRMQRMRSRIQREDVFSWCDSFCAGLRTGLGRSAGDAAEAMSLATAGN